MEIDENQHDTYEYICECARINEIVNGVVGKTVIIIWYNQDAVRNNGKILKIATLDRLDLLAETIKEQLT